MIKKIYLCFLFSALLLNACGPESLSEGAEKSMLEEEIKWNLKLLKLEDHLMKSRGNNLVALETILKDELKTNDSIRIHKWVESAKAIQSAEQVLSGQFDDFLDENDKFLTGLRENNTTKEEADRWMNERRNLFKELEHEAELLLKESTSLSDSIATLK